jgi:hypothetical protein
MLRKILLSLLALMVTPVYAFAVNALIYVALNLVREDQTIYADWLLSPRAWLVGTILDAVIALGLIWFREKIVARVTNPTTNAPSVDWSDAAIKKMAEDAPPEPPLMQAAM